MAKQIRRVGRWLLLLAPLLLLVVLAARPAPVQAATFTSPLWTNSSSNLECACATSCSSCGGPSVWSPEGVSYLSGAFQHAFPLLDNPAKVGSTSIGLLYRSDVDGYGNFGRRWIPSWETTVEKTILDAGSPESNGGHEVRVRYPSGCVPDQVPCC